MKLRTESYHARNREVSTYEETKSSFPTVEMVTLMGGRTIIAGMRPAVAITATQIELTPGNIETALTGDRALDMSTQKPTAKKWR